MNYNSEYKKRGRILGNKTVQGIFYLPNKTADNFT